MLDSGISNNCPTYAFLHPSRGTDVIINFDASSDVMSEAAPARNQEMGDMKGTHRFFSPTPYDLSLTASSMMPLGLTFTKRAHPFPVPTDFQPKPPQSASHPSETTMASSSSDTAPSTPPNDVPSTINPPRPIDGLPFSSDPSRASSFAPSSTQDAASEAAPAAAAGNKSTRAFEKAREEDVKRKAKAQAAGWTPQSIEKEFGGRYAQVSLPSPLFSWHFRFRSRRLSFFFLS